MRPKSIILLALALGCGLIASIGINTVLKQQSVEATVLGEVTPIFVANVDIKDGEPITPQLINLQDWPADKVPEGAYTKLQDLEGRRARMKLYKGEPLVAIKLFAKGEDGSGPLDELPAGMRTVPVKVDAVSGGAGLLKIGDHVDVLVHVNENPVKGILKAETFAPPDLQNLKIFAIDNAHRRDENGDQTVVAKTISLVVSPEQAMLVTFASQLGEIRLVGRNANDTDAKGAMGGQGIDLEGLRRGFGAVAHSGPGLLEVIKEQIKPVEPTPQPASTPAPDVNREVMIIREGATARQVIFENGVPIELGDGSTPSTPSTPAPLPDSDSADSTPPAGEKPSLR